MQERACKVMIQEQEVRTSSYVLCLNNRGLDFLDGRIHSLDHRMKRGGGISVVNWA